MTSINIQVDEQGYYTVVLGQRIPVVPHPSRKDLPNESPRTNMDTERNGTE